DLIQRYCLGALDRRDDVAHLLDVAYDLGAVELTQQRLGDDASGHARRCLTSARATTTAVVAKTILGVVRVVGVTRTVFRGNVRVIAALLILVAYQDGDARAGGAALEHACEDLRSVGLVTLRHDLALARSTPIEVDLQRLHRKGDPRRATIDDHDVSGSVRLAGGGDAKGLTEAVSCHGSGSSKGAIATPRDFSPLQGARGPGSGGPFGRATGRDDQCAAYPLDMKPV